MSKKQKREQKIRENPSNVSLDDFEWLVNQYGHIKAGGNHLIAVVGVKALSYKRTNPVHTVYVKQLLDMINAL
jgi:hypothetical protein